jgi:hypothetical protein
MRLFIHEAVGWGLVVLGLALISLLVFMAVDRQILESIALTLPATVVFRSGIGLVRLATSARLAARLIVDK